MRFFSIIIPAHNEEAIIGETLGHLAHLDYPADRLEILVVENGSSDRTLEKAQRFSSDRCKVLSTTTRGVSHARNLGARHASLAADWYIFLDADTSLPPRFLTNLDAYLDTHPNAAYGTTDMRPDRVNLASRMWYGYTNVTDRLIRVTHAVHIVRRDLAERVSFDETLRSSEIVAYCRALAKYGAYFYMKGNPVINSARRMEKVGYLKMTWLNIWHGILPRRLLQKRDWDVIR